MKLKGRDFYRQPTLDLKPPPAAPTLAMCSGCGAEANPCWGDRDRNYCWLCVPDALRRPSRHLKDDSHDQA